MLSLREMGMPWRGPRHLPWEISSSADCASLIAASAASVMVHLNNGLSRRARSSWASTYSVGFREPSRILLPASAMERRWSSSESFTSTAVSVALFQS